MKEIQVGNTSILDARIADTKLSVNTDFTKNQKAAFLKPLYLRSTDKSPIKGKKIERFSKPALIENKLPFIKIYSGGSSTSFGGIKINGD
ncbi:hypothetical protein [Flavobacterium oreochromis]|uniref:Uncharacterized protein n=1 Tax=Flavobacterium columnare TaxID=996 RepID=A0A246G7C5_9FLAO|nr:hypothetical protein [Flavobacterium oreochromis]OWP74345.1 hypothetical protein BWK62_14565 [Flavobacterium oreochromis]